MRAILTLLVFVLGAVPAAVAGQGVTAQVTGIVTDRDGGLVPGATVTITNPATGVIDTNPREAPSWNLLSGLNINGRNTGINLTYDRNTNRESHGGNLAAPGLDSIAEVRLQSSNFQAEYGRSSGASITLITRSGSSAFRGSGVLQAGRCAQRQRVCASRDRSGRAHPETRRRTVGCGCG